MSLETPCVVTHWRTMGFCMQLGHGREQGATGDDVDQENLLQGSPTLRGSQVASLH